MTKKETIQVLQSIEDRAVDFPYMTACDWVAIAAAKRHLENSLETKEVDLDRDIRTYLTNRFNIYKDGVLQSKKSGLPLSTYDIIKVAEHFFELGLKAQKGK